MGAYLEGRWLASATSSQARLTELSTSGPLFGSQLTVHALNFGRALEALNTAEEETEAREEETEALLRTVDGQVEELRTLRLQVTRLVGQRAALSNVVAGVVSWYSQTTEALNERYVRDRAPADYYKMQVVGTLDPYVSVWQQTDENGLPISPADYQDQFWDEAESPPKAPW